MAYHVVVVVVAVGGQRWMGRCKVHDCDEGIQSHVHICMGTPLYIL